ncbi:uncharacterized protein [Ptychodera flava]|uniref:uncharacterized protein n=1 Tax=Ptychodera flava TaxID=63121 RepID=UPI00396A047D
MMSEDPFSDNYMYKQGATVTYKCNPGFRLTGDSQLGCGESGLWKGTVPRCEKDCHGKPASISNGYYVIRGEVDGHDQYISGTEVTYYCDAQHTLFGNNKLYCSNGLWNGIPPTCKMQSVETCPMPKSSPHGYIITSKQSFSVGSKVKYTCEAGYQLEGDCRRTRTNECERECLPTGIWSGSPPICIPNGQEVGFCSDPGKPENGERCCQSSFQSGDKLSFYCDAGFARTGSSERTCLSDGSWSGSQPICYPVSSLATNPPDVDGIFLTNTTLTIVIATTGTVLGVLIIVILLSIRQCHYRNRRFSRSLPMRHSHRRANYSVSPDDIDRVALIAYANGLEVVLPSYEEATASVPRSRPPSFTETNESADNNNGNTTPAASVPNPIPLPPRTHSSRFRRLPRIPRGLRLPPPPPLSMLDERRTNPEQPSNSAGRSAEAGVQTQADSAPTDGAPSSGETERTCEPVEDDRTSDTAGLLLLENEISQVTSAAPNTDVTAQTCDAVEDDYDDVELLTDLGGPLEEEQTQENVQQDDSQEANREETQGTETSTMGTNDNHEHHEENPSSEDT